MSDSTTVRVSRVTRDSLRALAAADGVTLDEALHRLVRAERQRRMGEALAMPLTEDEAAVLQAGAATVADAGR